LQLPLEGILFEVEWNRFWSDGWGRRPARLKDALRTANYQLARVPRLIPVYSHWYLPGGRGTPVHPVLSVYQADIVISGADLLDYIDSEFSLDPGVRQHNAAHTVGFWSELVNR
jgi:hypothetical protein